MLQILTGLLVIGFLTTSSPAPLGQGAYEEQAQEELYEGYL